MGKKETDDGEGKRPDSAEKKWGKRVMEQGYSIVPSLLFRAQRRLGLNATQLALLLHLADHWWERDRLPFPLKRTLSERLNLSRRTVQRNIAELEAAGLVERIPQRVDGGGNRANKYDLQGLVKRLKELEPEFRQAREDARRTMQEVEKPGHSLKSVEPGGGKQSPGRIPERQRRVRGVRGLG